MMRVRDIHLLDPAGMVVARCPTPARARELADEINHLRESNRRMREGIEETLKNLPQSFVMSRNTLKSVIVDARKDDTDPI